MMTDQPTFFWYDLETSGISPRADRIMQFAGQRTTLDLEPLGEPVDLLVRLTDDILPQPDAVLLTGITPQQTLADGVTEAEFLRLFHETVVTPGTIFAGFNSIRFDDEFMRYLHYRNFYDPYQWQWQDTRSRWDLLDVVRMTRALRPEGIRWPKVDGKPGNRLELLTSANGIQHADAHDALSDVRASIEIARLVKDNQPKIFGWLLRTRDKTEVQSIVETDEPFVYTSGKYDHDTEKTTVVARLAGHPKKQGVLVYDLRYDPTPFLEMGEAELLDRWRYTREPDAPPRLPVKTLQFNRCPAVAPLNVLDDASCRRINIDLKACDNHRQTLQSHPEFPQKVLAVLQSLDDEQSMRQKASSVDVDAQLYTGFYDKHDSNLLAVVRAASPDELTADLGESFHDPRLKTLLARYKARNYSSHLTSDERTAWEAHRHRVLLDGGQASALAKFMHRLGELSEGATNSRKQFLLEELQLYAESIIPVMDDGSL